MSKATLTVVDMTPVSVMIQVCCFKSNHHGHEHAAQGEIVALNTLATLWFYSMGFGVKVPAPGLKN